MVVIAIHQIEDVIDRLSADAAFRTQYCQDPDATLEAYLSPDEIRAIKTGDAHRVAGLGCSDRWNQLTATLCGPYPGP
ncbi:MAG: hypothetical protein NVS2B16_02160 [Chloroflexota bacterium]